ncbi:hypothetical protein ACFHWW_27305 [Ensifer sp. P24N7]|uniref:Acb2/Tad1 domain-containing protein n=1 Tax=Sinorhizobium sp. P24N7 TaxID=3348358 RepID=UPI0035F44A00
MRVLTEHKVNPANDRLEIQVLDQPGAGGAYHRYKVLGYHDLSNPSRPEGRQADTSIEILFQNGPINEAGVNGVTQEVLLAIVADRLRSFQAGPYACRENALALTKLEEAMHWLHARTLARMQRGVEGTHAA